MKASTRDWVAKAEADYLAASDLARRRKCPLHDMVCFHCQQSAEKYLKARLEEGSLKIARTHDLETLLAQVLAVEPLLSALTSVAKRLTPFGVLIRYPGNDATKAQARQALADCKAFRREVRFALSLPS